jgi:hypothetical protein
MIPVTGKVIISPICSLASSLDEEQRFASPGVVTEMIFAYLNQYRFVCESYEELLRLFTELNQAFTTAIVDSILTPFDIKGLHIEPKFRHYTHLFIIGLKTLTDLFICLLDICQNKVFRAEHELPDFFNYRRKGPSYIINPIPEVIAGLDALCDDKNNWINQVYHLRNRIVHRGYLLRPEIGFKKLEKLIMKSYKGGNYDLDIDTIDLGQLYVDFSNSMNTIEQTFVDILFRSNPVYTVNFEVSMEYHDLVNRYNFKQINAPE